MSLLSYWKSARGPQIKQEWRLLLQRKWVLLFICTQIGVLIRICFLHLLLCPTMHPALLEHFMSVHDHHPYLFYYSVRGPGAEQPSAATSLRGTTEFPHVLWWRKYLTPLETSTYLEPNTQNQKPLFKYQQNWNKHLVPNACFKCPCTSVTISHTENVVHFCLHIYGKDKALVLISRKDTKKICRVWLGNCKIQKLLETHRTGYPP